MKPYFISSHECAKVCVTASALSIITFHPPVSYTSSGVYVLVYPMDTSMCEPVCLIVSLVSSICLCFRFIKPLKKYSKGSGSQIHYTAVPGASILFSETFDFLLSS